MSRASGAPRFRRLAFVILLCLQALTSWKNLEHIQAQERDAAEPVAEWERRLAPLREALPITQGFAGYVSDSGVACIACLNVDDQIEFTLTQYALAPIIVNKGMDYEWVIGNFGKGTYAAWSGSHAADLEVQHFPFGIYLIHRLDK